MGYRTPSKLKSAKAASIDRDRVCGTGTSADANRRLYQTKYPMKNAINRNTKRMQWTRHVAMGGKAEFWLSCMMKIAFNALEQVELLR